MITSREGGPLPFDTESFDLVISSEVLEHLLEMGKGVREVTRVLKPGELFVLTTPNQRQLVAGEPGNSAQATAYKGIEHFLGVAELREVLEAVGFVVE